MGLIEEIAALMLKEGEAKGQQAKLDIAKQEEERQRKHRLLKMTLKGLATFGPLFIPGGGIVPALGRTGMGVGGNMLANRYQAGSMPWDEEGIG